MAIAMRCPECQSKLSISERFAGKQARCPVCQSVLATPEQNEEPIEIVDAEIVEQPSEDVWDVKLKILKSLHGPREVKEYLEPPVQTQPNASDTNLHTEESTEAKRKLNVGELAKQMFAAMLDPRSIQWLLAIGGVLMVVGLLVWLISKGLFSEPLPLAIVLGSASLGLVVAGWFTSLKTKFKIAGKALTFLGCVVLPLNLWFWHAQDLVVVDQGLWIGGLGCLLVYLATVCVTRDPWFVYSVELGITLTAILSLADFGVAGESTYLSFVLMGLAAVSIHAYFALPVEGEEINRRRFGLPFFWSGHAQLAASLVILFGTQIAGWLQPVGEFFNMPEGGVLFTNSPLASGLLWLIAAYLYFVSDVFIRRLGVYLYLAAFSVVMAEASLLEFEFFGVEGMIAVLAITAAAISLSTRMSTELQQQWARTIAPLALVLSVIPVAIGFWLHVVSSGRDFIDPGIAYASSWKFVISMLIVAIASRVSAYVYQPVSKSLSAVYLFFTAGALLIAAAGALRLLEISGFHQAMLMMLIPIAYLVAARLWRGRLPERPLGWVAHVAAMIILAHVLFDSLNLSGLGQFVAFDHLLVAIVMAEATAFYGLAVWIRRRNANVYFAISAACMSVWQVMQYFELSASLFAIIFAALGLATIVWARKTGLNETAIYDASGQSRKVIRGRGLTLLFAGHGVFSIALVVAFISSMARLSAVGLKDATVSMTDWSSMILIIVFSGIAAAIALQEHWKRIYYTAAISMVIVLALTINFAIDLSIWRKLEIVLVAIGLICLAVSYIGRFRERDESKKDENVTSGLWTGSFLAAMPLMITVFHHWGTSGGYAFYDEIALITICLLMLVTGVVWQVKASTLFGGGTLSIYLLVLIVSLVYRPQVAIGIYLAAGGGVLFLIGLLLSIFRDRLSALPDKIKNREGVFRVISWR